MLSEPVDLPFIKYDDRSRNYRCLGMNYRELKDSLDRSGIEYIDEVHVMQSPLEAFFHGTLRKCQEDSLVMWRRAGNYTIIPDFLFEKGGIRVYMEIVGFWTQEYLERKFRKLSELKVENLIVAIDSANYRGKIPEIAGRIMVYRKTPDAFRVHRLLGEIEQPMRDELLKRATAVKVDGDCRTLHEIASGNDLPEDILKEAFMNHKPHGYIFDGANLISEIMAKKLRDEIISMGETDANAVIEFLNKRDIDASISTLIALGFEIEWIELEARLKAK